MKQKYEAPEMAVVKIELQRFLAGSGGFIEGDIIDGNIDGNIGIVDGTFDPGKIL